MKPSLGFAMTFSSEDGGTVGVIVKENLVYSASGTVGYRIKVGWVADFLPGQKAVGTEIMEEARRYRQLFHGAT